MSEAYRVMSFHHVTPSKRRRMLEEGLLPLLDNFSNVDLLSETIDDIMSHQDALKMNVDEFDYYENSILTVQAMIKGDWLVEYYGRQNPLYLHKLDGYRHDTRVHLYVKHFAHVAHSFKVRPEALSDKGHEILESTIHLETLPLSFAKMLERFEEMVTKRDEKRTKDQVAQSIEEAQRKKDSKRSAQGAPIRRSGRPSRNGEVRIIKPATKQSRSDII